MAATMDSTQLSAPSVHSTNSIPPYIVPLIQVLFGASAISRSTPLNLFALALGVYWLFSLAIYKPEGQHTPVYTAGATLITLVLKTLSARWLMTADEFERRGKDKEDKEDVSKRQKRGWWQWVCDVIDLSFMTSRGIGWNFQIKNLPRAPAPTTPRLQFAAKNLVSAAFNLLLVDLGYHHLRRFSHITSHPIRPLTSQPLPLALFNAWLIYIQARWTMTALFSLVAAITVPLHIFSPDAFPPLFGSFRHAYTVKRFWAFTWHQMMRTLQAPYTAFLVRKLKLDPRKKSTYWVKVCSAFFFAWIVHAYGTLITGEGYTADIYRYLPQVFAFWIEERVIETGRKLGCEGKKWRVLGYLWVFVFEGLTLLAWFAPAIEKGAHLRHPLGFSVVEKLLK